MHDRAGWLAGQFQAHHLLLLLLLLLLLVVVDLTSLGPVSGGEPFWLQLPYPRINRFKLLYAFGWNRHGRRGRTDGHNCKTGFRVQHSQA
jgi:hypothetical protein